MDLSKWEPEQTPVIELRGEWKINWDYPNQTIQVPRSWESQQGQIAPVEQKAVYELDLHLPEKALNRPLKVYLPNSGPAFRAWANTQLIIQNGLRLDQEHISHSRTQSALSFSSTQRKLKLRVEMRSMGEYRNGLRSSPRLGLAEAVNRELLRKQLILSGIMGATLIFMVYHLILFFQRKNERKLLYFSAICALCLIYFEFFHAHLLEYFIGEIPLAVSLRLTRLASYSFLPLSILYIQETFEIAYFKWVPGFVKVSNTLLLLSLLLPLYWTNIAFLAYLPLVSSVNLVTYWIIYKAWRYRRPGIGIFILSGGFFACCSLHDILYDLRLFDSYYLIPIGYFVFCLGQSTLLSRHFQDDFEQVKQLSLELSTTNKTLEHRVQERTEVLMNQSKEIKALLGFKEKIARMLAHDIKTPLSVVLHFSQGTHLSSENQAAIHRAGLDIQKLVNQLLHIKTLNEPEMPTQITTLNVLTHVEDALKSLNALFQKNAIRISNEVHHDLWVYGDSHLLNRVLQNLLFNALNAMDPGGAIQISSKNLEHAIEICIQNNGRRLGEETLKTLFDLPDHAEPGKPLRGLGLPFCKLAIEAQAGEISLRNVERGVQACFTLPAVSAPKPLGKLSLDPEEKRQAGPLLAALQRCKFYELSSIQTLLEQFESLPSQQLSVHAQHMKQALENFDEPHYANLLEVLNHAYSDC